MPVPMDVRYQLLLSLLLLTGRAAGQEQPSDVVIRSSAREVLLDVVVRDQHGRLVTNLKPEDVAVYEDGVRQDVRSFRLVAGSEVRQEDERQAVEARSAADSKGVAPTVRPPLNPLRTVNVVCLVLADLNAVTRAFAFESARKFVENELRPNTFIGVFTFDASGMRPVIPFSNNRQRLLEAVRLASVNQLPRVSVGAGALLNGLSMMSQGSIGAGDASADSYASNGQEIGDPLGMKGEMEMSTLSGLDEIGALKTVIRQLGGMPFQKTVLLLSTGITRPPDQLEYWDSMIKAAVDGGVTFYALDVHALATAVPTDPDAYDPVAVSSAMLNNAAALSRQQAATTQLPPQTRGPSPFAQQTMAAARQDDAVNFAVRSANTQEALRELAERTGGFLIANTNNVDHLLGRVMEEVDTHYEIAYPPKTARDDGHFRKIEVKLARANLHVETRSGYFALPDAAAHPLSPEEIAGLRALDTQPRPHAFNFLSRAYRFGDSGGATQYAIAFELPIANLTATAEEAAHRHRLHASLFAVVKNAQGDIVDRFSKDVPSEVSDDRLAAVRVELMTYQHAVSLAPGTYTVETAVVDHEGNRASTGVVTIESRPHPGLALSDLTLVRRLENSGFLPDDADPFQYASEYTAKRILPFVTTDLPSGAKPFVYFKIFPNAANTARPVLTVRLFKDGRPMANLKPPVPPPVAPGVIPIVLELTAAPGNYEVRATVTQGSNSMDQSLKYSIAAAPHR